MHRRSLHPNRIYPAINGLDHEIWSFVHAKAKNAPKSTRTGDPTIGDGWTWTAIEAQNKEPRPLPLT
jgi:hypothetical protein